MMIDVGLGEMTTAEETAAKYVAIFTYGPIAVLSILMAFMLTGGDVLGRPEVYFGTGFGVLAAGTAVYMGLMFFSLRFQKAQLTVFVTLVKWLNPEDDAIEKCSEHGINPLF